MTQITVMMEGGEYLIGTLPSFDMLHVKKDAAELSSGLDEEGLDFTPETVKRACLAAAVLKGGNGEGVFPSGLDALKGLTDEQLSTVAEAYTLLAERTAGSIFGDEASMLSEKRQEKEQNGISRKATETSYGRISGSAFGFSDGGNVREVSHRVSAAADEQYISDTVEGRMLRLVADTSEVQR